MKETKSFSKAKIIQSYFNKKEETYYTQSQNKSNDVPSFYSNYQDELNDNNSTTIHHSPEFLQERLSLHLEKIELLHRAQNFFPTTQMFEDFKPQIEDAYRHNDFHTISYILDTFEALKANETNPNYAQELDTLTKNPLFSTFSNILTQLSPQFEYSVPSFSSTPQFSQVLSKEQDKNLYSNTQSIVDCEEELIIPEFKQTTRQIIDTKEPLSFLDKEGGLVYPGKITTAKIEQQRKDSFEDMVSTAQTQKEIDDIEHIFETSSHSNTDTLLAEELLPEAEYKNEEVEILAPTASIKETYIETSSSQTSDIQNTQEEILNEMEKQMMLLLNEQVQ